MEVLIVFGSITAIVISIAAFRYMERMKMLNGVDGKFPLVAREIQMSHTGSASLFLGLNALAIGAALAVSCLFVQRHYDRDLMTVSLIFIFSGIGMLGYWRITAPDRKLAKRMMEERITREIGA